MTSLSVRLSNYVNRVYILPEDRCHRQGEAVENDLKLRDAEPNSAWLDELIRKIKKLETRSETLRAYLNVYR